MTSSTTGVVLVTGGSGFLGQHVIGLLQSHAPHVTEIMILDTHPYENKLGTFESQHDKTNKVEPPFFWRYVERQVSNASSTAIAGYDDIFDGTESTTPFPEKLIYEGYGSTKQKAEAMVLDSNCGEFRTASIRPVGIYGEEDELFITAILKLSCKIGRWTLWDCGGAIHRMTYAGNVAWMFICADAALMKESDNKIGGNVFFATDDTPCDDVFEMRDPFVKACKYTRSSFKLPLWLVIYPLYILYFILLLLSPLWKMNIPFGISSVKQMLVSFSFKNDKAKEMLDYRPLYSYDESFKRSMTFYKRFSK